MLACDRFGTAGRILAYHIAGHHAGLDDWACGLLVRLDDPASRAELNESLATLPPASILDSGAFHPDLRSMRIPGGAAGFALGVRMLFSCLVDADFLDTEAYMDSGKHAQRNAWPELADLLPRFDAYMADLACDAKDTPVNRLRADILAQCRTRAAEPSGVYSLTVTTGGGKTLSSLAFALEHAKVHHKHRPAFEPGTH